MVSFVMVLPEGFEPSRRSPSDRSRALIRRTRTPVLGSKLLGGCGAVELHHVPRAYEAGMQLLHLPAKLGQGERT